MTIRHEVDPTRPNLCKGQPPGQKLSVGEVSVEVVPANSRRVGLVVYNFGAKDAWLSWDEDAELEKGIPLKQGSLWNFDSGLVSQGPLNAITKEDSTKLSFQDMNRA